jgi:energy-coupling factor transport system ATP-binding protein
VHPKHWNDHVSFIFQDPDHQLFANTVWDEVAFSLRVRKAPETRVRARVTELLQRVHLLELIDRHPATLSRGERRRLAVATALSHPVDVLLLDEPTTGQDYRTLTGLFDILRRLSQEEGTTIIFVTHDMWAVWQYATRIVGLRDGCLIASGPTREVLRPGNEALLEALECELPFEAVLAHMLAAPMAGTTPATH